MTGEVETVNGGIVPVLQRAEPQGFNPAILILELTLENTGPGTTDIAYRPARYEEQVEVGQYTEVDIRWEHTALVARIDVEDVE